MVQLCSSFLSFIISHLIKLSKITTERVTQTKGSGTEVDVSFVNIGTRLCLNMNDQAIIICMASGTDITRTWQRNGTVISGVTGKTYTARASD